MFGGFGFDVLLARPSSASFAAVLNRMVRRVYAIVCRIGLRPYWLDYIHTCTIRACIDALVFVCVRLRVSVCLCV